MNRKKPMIDGKWLFFAIILSLAGSLSIPSKMVFSSATREASSTLTLELFTDDGKTAKEASVAVEGKLFKADKGGRIKIPGLTPGWKVVSTEYIRLKGGFLGFGKKRIRYIGFKEVFLDKEKEVSETVTLSEAADMDALCFSCHPQEATREHRIIKCLHVSGKEVPDKQVARVDAFNLENETLEKEGKPHYPPIVLEKRVVEVNGEKVEKFFLTCESCHSTHVKTPYRAFVIAPFETKSDLCRGCHV